MAESLRNDSQILSSDLENQATSSRNAHGQVEQDNSTHQSDSSTVTDDRKTFFSRPFLKRLLLPNGVSEARDMDAAERNFLAWLKISLYLSLCGAAIMINLRLGGKTSSSSLNVNDLILALDAAGNSSPSQKIQIMESFNSPETGHTHLFTYPLGLIFYILSFISILSSISNYVSTINGYFGRKMTVTSSILTAATITLIATTILASNIFVLWKMY